MILDSDILIWLLRGKKEIVKQFASLIEQDLCITPIQIAEIHVGLRAGEHEKTSRFLDFFTVLPLDQAIGARAGDLMREFRKSHQVDLPDALIAATALQHRLKLWTLNRKHYPMLHTEQFFQPAD